MKNVKAITILRSGKTLEDPYKTQELIETSSNQHKDVEEIEENPIPNKMQENDKGKAKVEDNPNMYKPKDPFPTALEVGKERKRQYIQVQNEEFMKLFQQVHINIPLLDTIYHVPAYAKFLKELCTQKREPKILKKIMLSEDVSVVLLNQLP